MENNALLTLLSQLGYNEDEVSLTQLKRILNSSNGIEPAQIVALNDHLKAFGCFVAMSGSCDYFKIKNVATRPDERAQVDVIVDKWADKHKFSLKTANENTKYILGRI
jgi:hypothetical protein